MRLLKLRLRNIASLKGEHEVDFEAIGTQSPLFAITGETGAGKSSLLNAIGLALYGQIYKRNVEQIDVVTIGERDAAIDLIFNVKGKSYLAEWRAKVRKPNGEFYSKQTASRLLYTIEKPEFSAPKTVSTVGTAELLNLDFDQFCKCIILNQGEFAKFLTSSFTERKDILEKLYPGELLESMGRALKLELDILSRERSDFEVQLSALRGDGHSGELLREQKAQFEQELREKEGTLKMLEDLDARFGELTTSHQKWNETKQKILALRKDMGEETQKLNTLSLLRDETAGRYKAAVETQEAERPRLQELLRTEEALGHGLTNLASLQESQGKTEARIQGLSKKLEGLQGELMASEEKFEAHGKKFTSPVPELLRERDALDRLFELLSENDVLLEELKGKTTLLRDVEATGLDLRRQLGVVEERLRALPANTEAEEERLARDKKGLQEAQEKRQRALIKTQEGMKFLGEAAADLMKLQGRQESIRKEKVKLADESGPLETTLKLQQVLEASEICLAHSVKTRAKSCPVCRSEVAPALWTDLLAQASKTDLPKVRARFEECLRLSIKLEQEEKSLLEQQRALEENRRAREAELEALAPLLALPVASVEKAEEDLAAARKQSWEAKALKGDQDRLTRDLTKSREHFQKLKQDLKALELRQAEKAAELSALVRKLPALLPKGPEPETVKLLKAELRLLGPYLELENQLSRLRQEIGSLEEQRKTLSLDLERVSTDARAVSDRITGLKTTLAQGLGGEKASDLINRLGQAVKALAEETARREQELKARELVLKDYQGRLHNLGDLLRDFELLFSEELLRVRELPPPELTDPVYQKLRSLDLTLASPRELFIPLRDFLSQEKATVKESVAQKREALASVRARLEDWEKRQDKIALLEIRIKDVTEKLSRKERLFEVLGKDELRTFVLSLVEENLIEQTNDELQKLCQGRYEIIHQSKKMRMTPEFYILDKYREGGMRKVSTLSGGETFMVSLAMALGLAELTRGQAEIDSLFIDEGFGTLDQDSLEDVLDMLQQIQTRGLMVGIISHIKPLTNSLPVNLVLSKRQDGTSTISTQFN